MSDLRLYCPKTVLKKYLPLEYFGKDVVDEFMYLPFDEKVKVLAFLLDNVKEKHLALPVEDASFTIHTDTRLKNILDNVIKKIESKYYLGVNATIYYNKSGKVKEEKDLFIPISQIPDKVYIKLDDDVKLKGSVLSKLLKFKKKYVVKRFLLTDLVFSLFDRVYASVGNSIKEYNKYVGKILPSWKEEKISEIRKMARSLVTRDLYVCSDYIYCTLPKSVVEFIENSFPLLTKHFIINVSIIYGIVSGKFEEIGLKPKDKDEEAYWVELESKFDLFIETYSDALSYAVNEAKDIDDLSTLQMKIVSIVKEKGVITIDELLANPVISSATASELYISLKVLQSVYKIIEERNGRIYWRGDLYGY